MLDIPLQFVTCRTISVFTVGNCDVKEQLTSRLVLVIRHSMQDFYRSLRHRIGFLSPTKHTERFQDAFKFNGCFVI
jgi:hypothetical protein